jgi:hypothetical protein
MLFLSCKLRIISSRFGDNELKPCGNGESCRMETMKEGLQARLLPAKDGGGVD